MKNLHLVTLALVALIGCQGGGNGPGTSPFGGPAMDNETEVSLSDTSLNDKSCSNRSDGSGNRFDDRVGQGDYFKYSKSVLQIDGTVAVAGETLSITSVAPKFIRGTDKITDSTFVSNPDMTYNFICSKHAAKETYQSDSTSCQSGSGGYFFRGIYGSSNFVPRNPLAGTSQCSVQQEYQVTVNPTATPYPSPTPQPSPGDLVNISLPPPSITVSNSEPNYGAQPSNKIVHRYSGLYHLPGGRVVHAYKTVTSWSGKMTCNDDAAVPGSTQEVVIETTELPDTTFVKNCDSQKVYGSTTAKDSDGQIKAQTIEQGDFN